MENRHQKDREWERLLRESLSEEKPEKQEMWYLPGVLHALILLLAALVICLLVQNPLLELLAAVTATVGSLTGFILTRLGVRMFDLKSRLTWYIER